MLYARTGLADPHTIAERCHGPAPNTWPFIPNRRWKQRADIRSLRIRSHGNNASNFALPVHSGGNSIQLRSIFGSGPAILFPGSRSPRMSLPGKPDVHGDQLALLSASNMLSAPVPWNAPPVTTPIVQRSGECSSIYAPSAADLPRPKPAIISVSGD